MANLTTSANVDTLLGAADFAAFRLSLLAVGATSTFGADNRILRSDGTGRLAQPTGIAVADTDQVTWTVDGALEIGLQVTASGASSVGIGGVNTGLGSVGVFGSNQTAAGIGVVGEATVASGIGIQALQSHASAIALQIKNIGGFVANFVSGATATRTITVPDASITVARSDAAQTFTGLQTFAAGIAVTAGSDLKAGTFTLVGGTVTHGNTSVTANSVILVTLKTVGGTRAGNPDIVPTAGVGFVATGAATDTSVYNYVIIN